MLFLPNHRQISRQCPKLLQTKSFQTGMYGYTSDNKLFCRFFPKMKYGFNAADPRNAPQSDNAAGYSPSESLSKKEKQGLSLLFLYIIAEYFPLR